MSKLPNRLAKLHQTALALLAQESLTVDQKWEVFERYQEGATNLNGLNGAFFTPMGLARDFGLNVGPCKRIIDLCAGIGALSFFHSASYRYWPGQTSPEIVCVEFNPEYLAAGRKLIPEATWIEASVLDLPDLGHFDVAISNPPFGRKGQPGSNKRYKGPDFEYRVIDIASDIADHGVFIVPTGSAPFEEGGRNYRTADSDMIRPPIPI